MKGRCRNCGDYDDMINNLCESCFTTKQEQISCYGGNSEEIAW